MRIALDIGNSFSKIARESPEGLIEVSRVLTAEVGEHAGALAGPGTVVGISSVVPAASRAASEALVAAGGEAPFMVSHRIRLPFEMAYRTPETLGNDRLAAAAGAVLLYAIPERAVIVVDAGTAVTYEAISAERIYRGGAIAPGPALLRAALHRGTAQLPEISDEINRLVIGDSTAEAIRSGVYWAFVDSVTGMIRRLREEVGPAIVVATGGWAAELAGHTTEIEVVDPHLVLHGTLRLMDQNGFPAQDASSTERI